MDAHDAKAREIAEEIIVDSDGCLMFGVEYKNATQLIADAIATALRDCEREAYAHARRLAESLATKHFPANTGWEPLDDARGVIDQIDNMTTALVHKDRLANCEREALERAAKVAADYATEMAAKWRAGHKSDSHLEGACDAGDDIARAISALAQEEPKT